jgi:hypothetical protein
MPAPVFQQQMDQRAAVAASRGAPVAAQVQSDNDNSFSFDDFLDIINPLQHLPVVSTIYRALTHDTIKPFERIAGDTLYGGLWGFASSVANVVFEKITGKDFGDTALALLTGDKDTAVAATSTQQQVAVATAAPAKLSALSSTGQSSGLDTTEDVAKNSNTVALAASSAGRNLSSDLGMRALAAYRRAVDLSQPYGASGALSPIF